LGKKVGDVLLFQDDRGREFKIRLVAALQNSILQGSLIISEDHFQRRFPYEEGYRFFLIDGPAAKMKEVSEALSRALQDVGFEVVPAAERLAAFNAVQNTYLSTFQVLGGLGLILGSIGLGIVVLRNVFERRGELAVLQAVGFRRRSLQWLVLSEHGSLLLLGLGIGILSAIVAVLPALLTPGMKLPIGSLAVTLALAFLNGALWTCAATWLALRGNLLNALRND
jgi:ABC-type antimicrobial peptide transport system permease subunit